jgi:hypothetical protein
MRLLQLLPNRPSDGGVGRDLEPWNLEPPGRTGRLNRQTVGIGFAALKINRVSILKWGELNTCRLRCRKV